MTHYYDDQRYVIDAARSHAIQRWGRRFKWTREEIRACNRAKAATMQIVRFFEGPFAAAYPRPPPEAGPWGAGGLREHGSTATPTRSR
jgi:hypothetical protein